MMSQCQYYDAFPTSECLREGEPTTRYGVVLCVKHRRWLHDRVSALVVAGHRSDVAIARAVGRLRGESC